MHNRSRAWLWSSAAISFIMGIIFVLNDNSGAGFFFMLMGIIYIGAATPAGQAWAASNPNVGRWGLIVGTLLLVLLVVGVGAVLLLKQPPSQSAAFLVRDWRRGLRMLRCAPQHCMHTTPPRCASRRG